MGARKRLLLVALIGVGLLWAVSDWMGEDVPSQQTVSFGGAQSEGAQAPVNKRHARSHLAYVQIGEAEPNAVNRASSPSANVTDGADGDAIEQEDAVPSDAKDPSREPASEAQDGDRATADDPSEDNAIRSISGWVQNNGGEPVPGIQVIAAARQLFRPQEGGEPRVGQTRQTARTDNEGFFEMPQLADGEYLVSTVATAEYKSAKATLRAGVSSAVLVVKGDALHKVYVYGTVSSSQGQALAGVRARAPGATGAASSGDDGRYSLALTVGNLDQSYSVRFTRRGYRTQSRKLDGASLKDAGEIRLDVVLEPVEGTATVAGTVWDTAGNAIPGARVRLSSADLQRSYTARSDHAGQFSFPEVEVGDDYRLWVRPQSDYKEYIREPITVPADGASLSVTLQPLGSGTLEGRMVDADGHPVPGFSLWLRTASPSTQRQRMVTSNGAGRFTVDDLPEGEVSFFTQSSPYLQVVGVHFSPEDQNGVQLALDFGSYEVGGYVLDGNGDPVAGAPLSLAWSLAEAGIQSRSKRSTVTDATGYFLFTQVGPGWHMLTVDAAGYRPTRLDHYVSFSGEDVIVRLQEEQS